MKYLLLTFFFISQSFAADCTSKLANLALASKMRAILTDKMYGDGGEFRGKSASVDEICKSSFQSGGLEEARDQKKKMVKIIQSDLRNKKKTNGAFLSDLDEDAPESLTEADICKLADKSINRIASHEEVDIKIAQGYANMDILGRPLLDSCKQMIGPIIEKYERRISDAKKETFREPPGEEIAPAEEPVVKKSVFKEQGVPQKTESIQPARTKSHTSSGSAASSQ